MQNAPRATHTGTWEIDSEKNIKVECYVMDNGERVLSLRGAARTMGLSGGGSQALTRNLNTQWISPYLSDSLKDWLALANRNELPQYFTKRGTPFLPFEASLFVDLCKGYVDAMHDNALKTEGQILTAERLYAVMTAFAKTGLVSVIDEVTGYQEERDRDELQKILAKYISEELLPWTKRFPDEFYKQMFRLKGWEYKGKPKPPYAGKLTNEYIYDYLPDGVLDELKQKTPKNKSGNKTHRYHQYLTEETGLPNLDRQLQQTIALMKAADTWEEFDKLFKKSMGEPIKKFESKK
ncbi:MAG: P63C domain-containing protein [Bacteroidales bacterium]|nr:P63C domain-containing protein [Anaerotignum sp.]MCI5678896.1 P63C domain-containing protein [Bacteroidales bacterium]MDY3927413.1 P63C domain-containing protein [Anaerotignum sp.]